MNGWNIMIAPPKGSNISSRLKESAYDKFEILKIINSIISSIIGIKSSCETTHTRIIKTVEINLIRPSRLWMGLSFDANSSNLIICVMSAMVIPIIILKISNILLFCHFNLIVCQLILKKGNIEIKFN